MGPNERRMKLMEVLCQRRHDTMKNLAFEFNVSERTIRNDINILSLSYPLETKKGRYDGGVKVMDGFSMNSKYLNSKQQELLERLSETLSNDDLIVMKSIFKDFALER